LKKPLPTQDLINIPDSGEIVNAPPGEPQSKKTPPFIALVFWGKTGNNSAGGVE
jgi:hypothetical protein